MWDHECHDPECDRELPEQCSGCGTKDVSVTTNGAYGVEVWCGDCYKEEKARREREKAAREAARTP